MKVAKLPTIERFVVHHSVSDPDRTTFEDILAWHTKQPKPGYRTIGYHYVILVDGAVRVGRPIPERGAHARGANVDSIGVCVTGDNTVEGFGWRPLQIGRLRELFAAARLLFPNIEPMGHAEASPPGHTICPGVDVRRILLP